MATMAARRPWPSFPDQNLPIPCPGVDHLAVSQSQLRERPPFFFLQCSMARLSMPPPPSPSCSFLLHRPRPLDALGTSPPRPRPREMDLPPSATSPPYRAHASTSGSGQRKPGQPRKQARPQQPPPPPPPVPPQQQQQQGQGQGPNQPAVPLYKILELNDNGPHFAPYQTKLTDIPVIHLDIRKEGLHGRVAEVAKRRIVRARKISPGCYYGVPITPYPNPKNGKSGWGLPPLSECGHSHHAIELLDTSAGDGVRVRLLTRDYDFYFPAFQISKDNGVTWSNWYTFQDMKLPPFISEDDITYLPITAAHSKTAKYDIGGHASFYKVFTDFANYPENRNKASFKEPAMIAVFLFSETIRDRFMHLEVLNRIKNDAKPFPLGYNMIERATGNKIYLSPETVNKRLHAWSMFGEICTDVGMDGGRFDASSLTENDKRLYGISHFEEMIGRDCGHLLIIMRDNHKMKVTAEKLVEMQKKQKGEEVPNPDFDNLFDKDGERIPLPTYDV